MHFASKEQVSFLLLSLWEGCDLISLFALSRVCQLNRKQHFKVGTAVLLLESRQVLLQSVPSIPRIFEDGIKQMRKFLYPFLHFFDCIGDIQTTVNFWVGWGVLWGLKKNLLASKGVISLELAKSRAEHYRGVIWGK